MSPASRRARFSYDSPPVKMAVGGRARCITNYQERPVCTLGHLLPVARFAWRFFTTNSVSITQSLSLCCSSRRRCGRSNPPMVVGSAPLGRAAAARNPFRSVGDAPADSFRIPAPPAVVSNKVRGEPVVRRQVVGVGLRRTISTKTSPRPMRLSLPASYREPVQLLPGRLGCSPNRKRTRYAVRFPVTDAVDSDASLGRRLNMSPQVGTVSRRHALSRSRMDSGPSPIFHRRIRWSSTTKTRVGRCTCVDGRRPSRVGRVMLRFRAR